MLTTSKNDLIANVASDLCCSKARARAVVDSVLNNIADFAHQGRLTIRGFGKFEARAYKPRTVRGGVVGEGNIVEVPARTRVVFKSSKELDQR